MCSLVYLNYASKSCFKKRSYHIEFVVVGLSQSGQGDLSRGIDVRDSHFKESQFLHQHMECGYSSREDSSLKLFNYS